MYGRYGGPRHDGRFYKSGGRFRGRSRTSRGGGGARAQQAALRAAREQARVLQGLLDASKETLQELSEKHSKASNSSCTARSRQAGESPSRHDHKVSKSNAAPALKAAAQTPTVLATAATISLGASEGGSGPMCGGQRDRARAPVLSNETAVTASAASQRKAERRSDGVRVTMTTTMAGVGGGGGMEQGHVSASSDGAACGAVDADRVLQEVLAWADTYQRQVAEGSADIFAGLLGEPATADHYSGFLGVSLEPWLRKGGQAVDVEEEDPVSARSSKRQRVEEVREAEQSTPSMPYDPSHGPLKYLHSSSSRQLWPDTDVVVCPYDLRGTCNDEECAFMHLSRLSLKGARDNKKAKGAATTPTAQPPPRHPRPYLWRWKPTVTLPAFRSPLLTGRGGVNHGMVVTMETVETGAERRGREVEMEEVLSSQSDDEGGGLGEPVEGSNEGGDAEGSDEEMSYLPLPRIDEVEHARGEMEVLIPHDETETNLAPTTTTANGPSAHHIKPEQQSVRYFSSLSPSQSPVSAPPPTLSDLEHRVSTHPHDVKAWLSIALATLATYPTTTDTCTTPPPSPSNRRSSTPAGLHMLSSPEHVSVWLSAWLDNGPPDSTAIRPVIRLLARALDALAGGEDGRGKAGGGGAADSHGGERAAAGGGGNGDGHRGGAANGGEDGDSVEGDAAQGLSVLWLLYLRLYTSLPLPPSHIRSTTAHEAVCTQQPGSLPLWLLSESMTRALATDLSSLLTYYQSSITHLCSLPPDPGSYGPPLAFLTVRYSATLLHSGHDGLACQALARVLGVAGELSTAAEIHAPLPESPSEPLLPYMSVSSASLVWAFYLHLLVTGDISSTLLSLASCRPSSPPEHAAAHTPSTWSVAWGWRTRLRLAGDRALLDSLRQAFTSLFTWLDSDDTSITDVIDGGSDGLEADEAEDLWIAVLEWNNDLLCDLWGGQRRGGPLWWRWGLGSIYTWTTAVRQARESWQVTWVDDLASWALAAAASPWKDGAALACTCEWLCDGADNPSTLAKTRGLLVAVNGRGLGRDVGAGSLQEGVAVEAHRLVREADTDDQDQRLFRMMIEAQVTRMVRGTGAAGRLLREAIAASSVKAHTPLEPMHRAQLWLELLALSPTAETVDAALCDVSSIVDMCGGSGGMGLEEAVEWSLSTRVMAQEHAHHACAALMSAVMSLHSPSPTHLCYTTLDRPTGRVPPSLIPLLARALIPQAVNRPSLTPVLLRLRHSLRGALMAATTAWSRRDRSPSLSPHGPRSSVKSTCGMLAQAMALTELALGEPGRAQKALESALALEPWNVGVWEFLLRLQAAFSTPQRVEQVTRVMLEQAVSPVNLPDARTRS